MTDAPTEQRELGQYSPDWIRRTLEDETTPPEWSDLHEYEPETPFERPQWIRAEGWRKWHATRDCGAETVYLIEDPMSDATTTDEHRRWKFYCARCGAVRWDELLVLHRDWYHDQFEHNGGPLPTKMLRRFDSLHLDPHAVLATGPLPGNDELRDVLRRSWYEREATTRLRPPFPWEGDADA